MGNSTRGSGLSDFVDDGSLFQFGEKPTSAHRNPDSINGRTERVLAGNTGVDVVNPDGSHVITLVEGDDNGADYGRFINHHTLSDIHEFRELEDEKMAAQHYINKYFLPDGGYKNNGFQGLIEELAGIFGFLSTTLLTSDVNLKLLEKFLFTLMKILSELQKTREDSPFRMYGSQDIKQLSDLITLVDTYLRPRVNNIQ